MLFLAPPFGIVALSNSLRARKLLRQDPHSAKALKKSQCAYNSIISGMLFVVLVLMSIALVLLFARVQDIMMEDASIDDSPDEYPANAQILQPYYVNQVKVTTVPQEPRKLQLGQVDPAFLMKFENDSTNAGWAR